MGFDSAKVHGGRVYSGMGVGGRHEWRYPDGAWLEQKVAPDEWGFSFNAVKERRMPAPEGSGSEVGSRYHWLIVAHQYATKLSANSYDTRMVGHKYKVGHKRPHWRKWSYQYPDQASVGEQVRGFLQSEVRVIDAGLLTAGEESTLGEPSGVSA